MASLKFSYYFTRLFFLVIFTLSTPAESGIISALSKLGKVANKVDVPDAHLSNSAHFKDIISSLPDGSAAEIYIVNGRWMAKSADGKPHYVDEFAESNVDFSTLIVAEANVPGSLSSFSGLPERLKIKIISRNGKVYSLSRSRTPPILKYQNIEVALSDSTRLDSVLWQLQRPVMTQKVRFVNLAKDSDAVLPNSTYGSSAVVDAVGSNKIVKAIRSLRMETMVLAGNVENGFLYSGGQRIAIKKLEEAAASRDVNLIILGSEKPKKVLQKLADDWKTHNDSGDALYNSVGDFYNRFAPDESKSMRIKVSDSGELQTGFHIEKKPNTTSKASVDSGHITIYPLHLLDLLVESVKILQPNEERVKELDLRIFPAVHSSFQLYIIVSFFLGIFTAGSSWFLYQKIWLSPVRGTYSNAFSFTIVWLSHRICFIGLYLPLLGIFSPVYLVVKWTIALINYLLLKPIRWLFQK